MQHATPRSSIASALVMLLAVLLVACPPRVQNDVDLSAEVYPTGPDSRFERWDVNNDGAIDAQEFFGFFDDSRLYGLWDADEDGYLEAHEFLTGFFREWDLDDDGHLSQTEYHAGLANWMRGEHVFGSYAELTPVDDWQVPLEHFLSEAPRKLFDAWDLDGDARLDAREMESNLFAALDADEDGALSHAEIVVL